MNAATGNALREQQEYYSARASEYDQWWLRQGRYDRGAECNAQWFADAEKVREALKEFAPSGRILELACGTGIWTEELVPFASQLTAVDGSAEMLAINAARLRSPLVRYIEADLFAWRATEQFDTVFFGFWLSHVPPERFKGFWELIGRCLAPTGRVFFVDSKREATSMAVDHKTTEPGSVIQRRRLNDGREFDVYKVFYEPVALSAQLHSLGWNFDVRETERYFLYGTGHQCCAIAAEALDKADKRDDNTEAGGVAAQGKPSWED